MTKTSRSMPTSSWRHSEIRSSRSCASSPALSSRSVSPRQSRLAAQARIRPACRSGSLLVGDDLLDPGRDRLIGLLAGGRPLPLGVRGRITGHPQQPDHRRQREPLHHQRAEDHGDRAGQQQGAERGVQRQGLRGGQRHHAAHAGPGDRDQRTPGGDRPAADQPGDPVPAGRSTAAGSRSRWPAPPPAVSRVGRPADVRGGDDVPQLQPDQREDRSLQDVLQRVPGRADRSAGPPAAGRRASGSRGRGR